MPLAAPGESSYGGEMTSVTPDSNDVRVLGLALDQAGDVLEHVHEGRLGDPTPCSEWDVATLADHLVEGPARFLMMMRGEEPDWSAAPPHITDGWAGAFRSHADDLIHAWHQIQAAGGDAPFPPGMQVAEFAVHTGDLASAIDFPVDQLDAQVAEAALAFLEGALKPEFRGDVFAPERPAPPGATPYAALAAFAGRAA